MFATTELIVVTTEFNEAEVDEYLPYFAQRYALPEDILSDALALLPVRIYSAREYASHLSAAQRLLSGRDEDDVALAALALKLQIPVWSNDNDYAAFPTGVFTTAKLLKVLGL